MKFIKLKIYLSFLIMLSMCNTLIGGNEDTILPMHYNGSMLLRKQSSYVDKQPQVEQQKVYKSKRKS